MSIRQANLMVCIAIGVTCHAMPTSAEEDYWPTIRALLKTCDDTATKSPEAHKAAAEAARNYTKSLTAEQLIVAGRQCAQEVDNDAKDPHHEGALALGFFLQYYPAAANDLRDIGPILREIKDKTQPPLWRSELVRMLLGRRWDAKLTNHRRQQVFDLLEDILNDGTDSLRVRTVIPRRLAPMLSRIYKDYSNDVRTAGPEQTTDRKMALGAFTQRVNAYVDNNLKLFTDPRTPLLLREPLLDSAIVFYRHDLPGGATVKDALAQEFTKYQDYPESLWLPLARYAKEDLHVATANDILDQMIGHASSESLRQQLQALKTTNRGRTSAEDAKR